MHRGRPAPHPAAARDALPRRAADGARRRGRALPARESRRRARCPSACSATPPRCAAAADGGLRGRHRHRPDDGARPAQRLRARPLSLEEAERCGATTRTSTSAARAPRWPRTARRWWASWTAAPRSSTTATACAPRRSSAASSARSTTPASCPPTSGRCSARARGRSAGWRCPAIPADIAATDRAVLEVFPDDERLAPLDPAGGRAGRVPGPAGADLLARLRRARTGRAALQRDGGVGRADARRS